MRCFLLLLLLASGASAQTVDDARRLALSGDDAAALSVLLALDDPSPEARVLTARLALTLSRPHIAVDALAEADTTNADAQLLLGRALQALGDARGAETAFAHAHRLRPGEEGTAALAALLDVRRPHLALPLYRLLVERDSLNPVQIGALGRVYARVDSVPLALETLSRAYDLYPRGETVALALVEVLNDSLEAQTAFLDRALEALPQSAELWRLRGAAAMRAGANPLAVQAYRNALIHDDSTASRLRDLGVALYYEGSVPEAFDVLQASYERDSTDATTLRVYGYAASENGQMPLAFDLLAMAADAMGREPLADLYERIARLHSEDLNDETALEYVELAERLMPERLTLILNRAIVLQQGGRSREALAAYREYLERAPEAPERLRLAAESRIAMLERVEEMREMARQRRIQEDLRRRLNE